MDDIFQQQADRQELENKAKDYSLASQQNQELNNEHKQILSKFYEHIALYSAGAITFTTTILGFVLPSNASALTVIKFYLPNITFLYIAWLGFGISFVSSILSKRLDAYYLSAFGFANYTKRYHEYLETQVSFIKKYEGSVTFTSGTEEEVLQVDKSNIGKLKEAHTLNDKNAKKYFKYFKISTNVALIGAGVGLLSLILFAFLLTQSIIYK